MRFKIAKYWFLMLLLWGGLSQITWAQSNQTDSLIQLLKKANLNTYKVRLLIRLADEFQHKSVPQSFQYAKEARKLSEKLNYKKGIGEALYYMSIGKFHSSQYTVAQNYLNKALVLYKSIDYKKGIADVQKQLGKIYDRLGDYEKALEYHINSLRANEIIANKKGMAAAYLDIGRVYFHQSDYYKSLEYYREGLVLAREIDNDDLLAEGYKNMGMSYQKIQKFVQSLKYYRQGLKIYERIEDHTNIAKTLLGIGNVYLDAEQPNKALEHLLRAREIQQKEKDLEGLGYAYLGIGKVYTLAKNYKRAIDYLSNGLKIFKSIGSKKPVSEAYLALSQAYKKQENYKQAHQNYQLYKTYSDSLFNETQSLQIAEMETRLNLRMQELKVKRLSKEQEVKDEAIRLHKADLSKQRTLLGILMVSSVLILALAFVLLNSRRKLRRGNRKLLQKNRQIERQKKVVEGQHRKITDGLRYAETIQLAVLPSDVRLNQFFREHFVIYKAKDMVSGDFYWIEKLNNKIVVAVVDCTGHGVSGAFMSMIGNTLLNEIVRQKQIISPATILSELHNGVVESLRKRESNLDLGMEACVCVLEGSENAKQKLTFAGAKRPLYYIYEEKITEIRGTRKAVGFDFGKTRVFKNQVQEVEQGGVIYLTTDGYGDQSGENNKRLGSGRFKDLLVAYSKEPLVKQKEHLEKALQKHQGDSLQRDDITVLGLRV
ncbi:tetratricopeptide repeat protein [uncultured Microscilla sp.]|uniref:tetratricopeptide repeat protein n=1 Tax=uncultured Microscilla sp. TaxID=432653 RepID=UPI00260A5C5A|nr:tetratricopeptide repeat protein [uncultured Microscilla sp.]